MNIVKAAIKEILEVKGEVMNELKVVSDECKMEVGQNGGLDVDLMGLSTGASEFWKVIEDEVDCFTEMSILSFTQYIDVI